MNSGPGLPACWEWMPGGSELREKDALTGREGVKVGRYFLEEANRYVGDRTEGPAPHGDRGVGEPEGQRLLVEVQPCVVQGAAHLVGPGLTAS